MPGDAGCNTDDYGGWFVGIKLPGNHSDDQFVKISVAKDNNEMLFLPAASWGD